MGATRLARRVIARLEEAELREPDAHYRDDLQIARLTVHHAATGDAIGCTPDVLACYEVLGVHPEKVWAKIEARRKALGPLQEVAAKKKPPQSVKLWFEKTNGARAVNSRAGKTLLRDNTISVPMAAPSIAALYPNPDAPSSAKKREFTYEQIIDLVWYSGAPASVKIGTIAAIYARGRWPKQNGPVTGEVCVSLIGMMVDGGCCKRTAQRRIKRACELGFWRQTRKLNSWLPCPKCGSERTSAKCPKPGCEHKGSSRNLSEFRRPFTYEIDFEKFQSAPRCREIHSVNWRTYAEYKSAAKRGEHPNVTEMPRQSPAGDPPPKSPAPARPQEPARKTAEHQKQRTVVETQIDERTQHAAKLLIDMCGLPDEGIGPYIVSAVIAESRFTGLGIDDAAKAIAECVQRDQRKGIGITRFYFRDAKWRTSNGGQTSAAQQRADHNKRAIYNGLVRRYSDADPPDGAEREDDPRRRGPSGG